jgi:AP-3 complex subunit beta
VSVFFPSVVCNIVSESFEVKVLVYMFLVRTADQKPEEALLSINSFQKDLAHPNPRVRALALRVMSSIRIQVIVPVVILAARKCAVDPSPYVRKAAAHAIPKIFRMDDTRQDELIEIIETMLRDSTPFVLSSAVAAFTEVCPNRIDLLHRHYRKICRMLVDMDEWGQILMSEVLLRYARSQFLAPDSHAREIAAAAAQSDKKLDLSLPSNEPSYQDSSNAGIQSIVASSAAFYSESEEEDSDDDSDDSDDEKAKKSSKGGGATADNRGPGWMDEDHRLLLRCTRPLLQSQNSGVVMAVAALHFYLSPVADLPKVVRALVFAAHSKPEVQHIVVKNICTMVTTQPLLFQPHFAAFFVSPRDPLDVRALKLEILTHVVTSDNAPLLLRELQAYLRSSNHDFVALTIRAIGRCAAIMPQIASVCIRSLLELSLHPSPKVASEAVVVIRALVQQNPKEHIVVVMRLMRRLDQLIAPEARAAVVWLAGGELFDGDAENIKASDKELREKFFKLSVEMMGHVVKGFADEHDTTKQQIVNTCCKMYVQDPMRISSMLKMVFALGAADPSVDMRDRIRVFRALFPVDGKPSTVKQFGDPIVLCSKPEPKIPSPATQTCEHVLGSLSHFMEHVAPGYTPMSAHPKVQPPTNVREQYFAGSSGREGASAIALHNGKTNGLGSSGFYSSSDESDSDSDSDSSSYTGSDDSDDSDESDDESDDDSDDSSDESDEADSSDESDSD